MPTQDKHPSHTRSAGQINSLAYKLTKTATPEYINSSTCKLKDSSTQKLKLLSFILQYRFSFHSVLAKK